MTFTFITNIIISTITIIVTNSNVWVTIKKIVNLIGFILHWAKHFDFAWKWQIWDTILISIDYMQKKWPKACPCVLWRFDWHRPDTLRFILPTPSNFTTHLFGAAPVIIPQIQTFLDLIYTDFLNVSYWVSSLMRINRI